MFLRDEPTKRSGEEVDEVEETGMTTALESFLKEESSITLKTSSGDVSLKTSIFLELPIRVASVGAEVEEVVTVVVVVEEDESEGVGGVGMGVEVEEESEELVIVVVVVLDEVEDESELPSPFLSSSAV